MTDNRAFGYVYGSPENGHRFFGIKTEKAAGQVVVAMRDLFQVVFEMKKKEIDEAKQSMESDSLMNVSSIVLLISDLTDHSPGPKQGHHQCRLIPRRRTCSISRSYRSSRRCRRCGSSFCSGCW